MFQFQNKVWSQIRAPQNHSSIWKKEEKQTDQKTTRNIVRSELYFDMCVWVYVWILQTPEPDEYLQQLCIYRSDKPKYIYKITLYELYRSCGQREFSKIRSYLFRRCEFLERHGFEVLTILPTNPRRWLLTASRRFPCSSPTTFYMAPVTSQKPVHPNNRTSPRPLPWP